MVSLLSYQSVLAQMEDCSFSDSEIEGIEVGQMGDRQIYTLFTHHLSDQRKEIHAIIDSHTPEDSIPLLNELIEKYRATIESEQSDVQKIAELVGSGQIDWIGVESVTIDTSYVNDTAHVYLVNLQNLSVSLNHLPGWDIRKTFQLLFLNFQALIIARTAHPEDFRRISIYPLEDKNLKIESADRINDSYYWDRVIREDPHVTFHQYSSVNSLLENSIMPRPRLITESEFEDLLNRLEVPEEPRLIRIRMRRLIMVHNDVLSIALKRDEAVVQSILDIPGNGLVLFGTAHGPGIKEGLITVCQNGHGSP